MNSITPSVPCLKMGTLAKTTPLTAPTPEQERDDYEMDGTLLGVIAGGSTGAVAGGAIGFHIGMNAASLAERLILPIPYLIYGGLIGCLALGFVSGMVGSYIGDRLYDRS